jgi:hypothetical protein
MRIHMIHENGNEWEATTTDRNGTQCFVLSNKNSLGHGDPVDGSKERGNEERFHIYVPDARSVVNGLQFGLSIRMVGIGNDGNRQNNLFVAHRILVDGVPVMDVEP